jgi:hypothetical protein
LFRTVRASCLLLSLFLPGEAHAEPVISIQAFPPKIVLGVDHHARLTIRTRRELPVQAFVNVGQVSDLKRVGPVEWTATYQPPPRRFPQVAILAFREEADDGGIGFIVIPLHGQQKIRVETKPLAKVIVRIAEVSTSPVRADSHGAAVIPIRVPPGVGSGEVTVVDGRGRETKTPLDLRVPPFSRVLIVPHRRELIADGKQSTPFSLVAIDVAGRPGAALPLKMTANLGTIGTVRDVGGGVYEGEYQAPVRGTAASGVVSGAIANDAGPAATTAIALKPIVPRRIARFSLQPTRLIADGRARGRVEVMLDDGHGVGIPGEDLAVDVSAGQVAPLRDRGGGRYVAQYTAPGLQRQANAEPVAIELRVRHVARRGESLVPPGRLSVFLEVPGGLPVPVVEPIAAKVEVPKPEIPAEPPDPPVEIECPSCPPPPPDPKPRGILGLQVGGMVLRGAAAGSGASVTLDLGYRLPVLDENLYLWFSWSSLFPRGTATIDATAGEPSFQGWIFPLTVGLRYRATPSQRVGFSLGLELGILLANLSFDVGATGASQHAVLPMMELPVSLDVRVGSGSLFFEGRLLQSFSQFDRDPVGVTGTVTGIVFAAGYRLLF